MPMDITNLVDLPNYNTWARPVTVMPLVSQPGVASYEARGIWHRNTIDVMAQDGTIFSDHKQTLCIRDAEFAAKVVEGDRIDIPATDGHSALGMYEITEVWEDGEGGSEMTLRKIATAKP